MRLVNALVREGSVLAPNRIIHQTVGRHGDREAAETRLPLNIFGASGTSGTSGTSVARETR